MFSIKKLLYLPLIVAIVMFGGVLAPPTSYGAVDEEAVGITGRIPSPPPTRGATIAVPGNGQTFTEIPITVSGICPQGLLVKLFKNNIFAGSQDCTDGSYSIVIDLFGGQNDLVARVFDALDQPGPDSNTVSVNFVDNRVGSGTRVSITTNFAKRGANPGDTLTWPVSITGGRGPYAISIDWGDGKPADLLSREFGGELILQHVYDVPGVYNIIIKVTDADGISAFLQVVGVGNGPLSQTDESQDRATDAEIAALTRTRIIWQPAVFIVPFVISTFWLGKRYAIRSIKIKLARGERPF